MSAQPSISRPKPNRFYRIYLTLLLVVIGLGIIVRSVNLGSHAYWVDEVHTAVRIAGYTKEDITVAQFDNHVHTVAAYNKYQQLDDGISLKTVLNTLAQHPEHPPLYYLLVRGWLQVWQFLGVEPSIAGMRSLSVVFGILLLPAIALLGRELFPTTTTSGIAVALIALSPLHILYAQESREYSLWTLVTVMSCWGLLRAIRHRTVRSWISYGIILTVGWYSHLLFATVAIAQFLYGVGLSLQSPAFRRVWIPMGIAIAMSMLPFLPWVGIIIQYFSQIQTVVDATQRGLSIGYLVDVWGRNLSRVLFSGDLAGVNSLVLLLVLASLVYLWRTTLWRVKGLILLLIGVNAIILMVPDAITGTISSSRIRYLIPAYLGIQLAIAYLLANFIQQNKGRWGRPVGLILLVGLLLNGAIAGTRNLTQLTNWAKSDKSAYYPAMATVINASVNPLVITDASATYTLVLTAQLRPDISLLLVNQPNTVVIPAAVKGQPISTIFVFAPSPQLQDQLRHQLSRRSKGKFDPVVRQNNQFQLLQWSNSPYRVGEEKREEGD